MNNDILAINSQKLKEHDLVEWQYAVMTNSAKAAFVIVAAGTAIIFIAALIAKFLQINIVSISTLTLIAICFLVAIFCRFVCPNLLGKLRYKQYCATHNSKGRVVFYADHLETMVGDETVQKLFYTDIKRIIVSENLYIMTFPHLIHCIVRRDGFSSENFDIVQKSLKEYGKTNGIKSGI